MFWNNLFFNHNSAFWMGEFSNNASGLQVQ